jgi:spermidine/putrescine transport system permease protein
VRLRRRVLGGLSTRGALAGWAQVTPAMAFLLLFFLLPLVMMLGASFLQKGVYGGVEWVPTLEHYRRFTDEIPALLRELVGQDPGASAPIYLTILVRTLAWSIGATLLCLGLGYPVAWTLASAGRWKNVLVFLVIVPLWSSFLVRTFAMIFLMRDSGLINTVLKSLGLVEDHLELLYTPGAVMAGLVYGFLPFMILPIYTSLEKLDPALLEAAEVLGAKPAARFWKVVWPLSLPGVAAGCLLTFIPALGSYLTSDLLGGSKEMMIGNLVQNQFTTARNWPFGSAASFIVMAGVLVAVLAYLRMRDRAPGGGL